jgi:S1-C subfamily serine protease/regulator of sirC expression with transglutaminase-like and TPR domain
MLRSPSALILAAAFLSLIGRLAAQEAPSGKSPKTAIAGVPIDVEALTARARKSLVVVGYSDRDGKRTGVGTGFVISPDGLIATNLHVIGEARPISVELADGGKQYPVTTVHASERSLDLAIIKVEAANLPALTLADSSKLKDGQSVVAMGNPHGLAGSVVQGVVSGRRTIDGKPMIQLAIPIEPGNSGGPLLDAAGNVHGILTLKSAVTQNLGFAVEINALKPLLEKPNPVPMARWLTIGALDPKEWRPYLGARWRQRAGRILVEGDGTGFGKRSYCLWQYDSPKGAFEATVTVRLDDERGAAGLIFAAEDVGTAGKPPDAREERSAASKRHYGFYPTAGQLRLTRFDGPDVQSWTVLQTASSDHYRRGEWNTLKVRIEEDQLLCYVNDALVFKADERARPGNRLGLVKFRETKAEFRGFRVAEKLPPSQLPADVRDRVARLSADVPVKGPLEDWVGKLAPTGGDGVLALRERARQLEEQATQLRQLAREVHHQQVIGHLSKLGELADEKIELLPAALWIARLDNDEVEVDAYLRQVDRLAGELGLRITKDASEADKLKELNRFFFTDYGFHGSRTNYYHRSNSYMNEVLDDREGLPIALSVLYMELGRRAGLNIQGVGLPGHFVVKHVPAKGGPSAEQLIDVFDGGKPLSRADAEKLIDQKLADEHLAAAGRRAILVRMISNLLGLAQGEGDLEAALRYADAIVAIAPEQGHYRGARAVLRAQTKRIKGALADCDWLLKHRPEGVDIDKVEQLRDFIRGLENPAGP